MRKALLIGLSTGLLAFILVQLVPYRVTNPPVTSEPPWDSARTRELAVAACFDCHSNETETAWFEKIAPLSWWITSHVEAGRGELNFSEWAEGGADKADDAAEVVREREMPPGSFTRFGMHPEADLTVREREELADGLRRTVAASDDD